MPHPLTLTHTHIHTHTHSHSHSLFTLPLYLILVPFILSLWCSAPRKTSTLRARCIASQINDTCIDNRLYRQFSDWCSFTSSAGISSGQFSMAGMIPSGTRSWITSNLSSISILSQKLLRSPVGCYSQSWMVQPLGSCKSEERVCQCWTLHQE